MNHRERLLAALNHQEPDRVPVDLGGMGSTGIMAVAYARLREHLDLPPRKVRINDLGQQLADIHEDVLEYVGADVVSIHRTLAPSAAAEPSLMPFPLIDHSYVPGSIIDAEMIVNGVRVERIEDGWGVFDGAGKLVSRKRDSAYYFDPMVHALADAQTVGDIVAHRWDPPSKDHFAALRRQALYLRENTEYGLMASFGGNILEMGQSLRGWDQFMMDLACGGPFTHYLLDYMADRWMAQLALYLEAVGDLIDVMVFGDDLGTQSATQLSLDLYRQTIHPRHKRLYQYVREHYPNVHVFLHSCGAISELFPMLIDEGVQIVNPVQTSATGMDPRRLKREFGRDLVFWGGGVDTQSVLPQASPDEVRAMVRERIEILGEGGGFVFCQVHNIQAGVPVRNIVAMYQAVAENR